MYFYSLLLSIASVIAVNSTVKAVIESGIIAICIILLLVVIVYEILSHTFDASTNSP